VVDVLLSECTYKRAEILKRGMSKAKKVTYSRHWVTILACSLILISKTSRDKKTFNGHKIYFIFLYHCNLKYIFLFLVAPNLEHSSSVKRFVSLQFLNPKRIGRTP
jgi:hypothetical protein